MTTLRGVFRISGLMVSNHPDSRFPLRRNAGVFMPENSGYIMNRRDSQESKADGGSHPSRLYLY